MKIKLFYGVIVATVIIVLAVILSTVGTIGQTPSITLPSPGASSDATQPDNLEGIIAVTKDTVQSVLTRLSRAESFSRAYLVTTYWSGGESQDAISYWQKGNNVRMSIASNGTIKNILILEDTLYVWYDSSSEVRSYQNDGGIFTADRYARLISYEELLETDKDNIIDAGYIEKLGEPCIFAEYSVSDNYVNRVYVSVSSGLLVASERLENGKLAISMGANYTNLSTPADDIFAVPD